MLATDAGTDVYFVGLSATTGDVVVDSTAVAAASGVSQGYLLWDADEQRHRAYFNGQDGGEGLHQLTSIVVGCRAE